ncbi:hypothetical protein TWF481_005308 [Arthrobotrys musiformis]|uniref:C2H2-type domain-containing protein n=1 Tax=Arthrobotrys musiformis TaxID=47236 RepID=A0AAV9WJ46_9PEZI
MGGLGLNPSAIDSLECDDERSSGFCVDNRLPQPLCSANPWSIYDGSVHMFTTQSISDGNSFTRSPSQLAADPVTLCSFWGQGQADPIINANFREGESPLDGQSSRSQSLPNSACLTSQRWSSLSSDVPFVGEGLAHHGAAGDDFTTGAQFKSSEGHTQKKRKHSCSECEESFTSRKAYGEHMNHAHSNPRPFKCDHCNISVARHDNLKSHLRACKQRPRILQRPSTATSNARHKDNESDGDGDGDGDGDSSEVWKAGGRNQLPRIGASNAQKASLDPKLNDTDPAQGRITNPHLTILNSNKGPQIKQLGADNDENSGQDQLLLKRIKTPEEEMQLVQAKIIEVSEERDIWRREYFRLKRFLCAKTTADFQNGYQQEV